VPLARFDEAPAPLLGLDAAGGTPLWDVELGERVTFVLGAEREGLPAEVRARCDELVAIPQAPAAESLNVGVAGALALYEWRRRGTSGRATPR
jgi:tRNA G18 (ribose-2'-O)-methylase SpoU